MVSPLDIGVLKEFSGVFPFLLVLVLLYAILSQTAWFKEKKGIAALVAVIGAFMTLLSPVAIKTINLMAPWFVLFVIFVILFILAFMVLGYDIQFITKFVSSGEYGVGIWVMAIMLIIGLGSLAAVLNEEVGLEKLQAGNVSSIGTGGSTSAEEGFWQTLFHPKILGMVLIMLIAFFSIRQLSKSE